MTDRIRLHGTIKDAQTGKNRKVHALIFTAVYSRHMFVWLTYTQTLAAVIAGCEMAWAFFGGVSGIAMLVAAMMTPLWFLAPIGGVLLLLGIVCGRWNATVDHRGLTCTTRLGLGLGRFTMTATAQTIADVTEVRGISEFLGWGLRIGSARSVALILHNGKALRVQDPHGRSLTVTVKDPATPTALFNAQAERHKQTASG